MNEDYICRNICHILPSGTKDCSCKKCKYCNNFIIPVYVDQHLKEEHLKEIKNERKNKKKSWRNLWKRK